MAKRKNKRKQKYVQVNTTIPTKIVVVPRFLVLPSGKNLRDLEDSKTFVIQYHKKRKKKLSNEDLYNEALETAHQYCATKIAEYGLETGDFYVISRGFKTSVRENTFSKETGYF